MGVPVPGKRDGAAVIVAAGTGRRAGGGVPKQYRRLAGRPLLRWTLEAFRRHARMGRVQVVIHRDHRPLYDDAVKGLDLPPPAFGGACRQESVLAGLEALAAPPPPTVLIHDAARPFPTAHLIESLLDAVQAGAHGAIPVLPLTDTVKRCRADAVVETLDRSRLVRVQTPQAFAYGAILEAHRGIAGGALPDDAAVAEAAGLKVHTVAGEPSNIKVTTPADLDEAARRLERRGCRHADTRVGIGFDVHAFRSGDRVLLCGVAIPHDHGLAGDSDADVALHALADAMLGALGEGDLGRHAPPGDPAWRGRDSADLVTLALDLAGARGARLVNADLTIICERPRLAPHQPAMRRSLARLLGLDPERVNVKATSTDGLGFAGRGEGIAAQAVVALELAAP